MLCLHVCLYVCVFMYVKVMNVHVLYMSIDVPTYMSTFTYVCLCIYTNIYT